tara:strand:+ start:65 stop:418 length:354 start_codon:yes stop_codon:yes gene_type:complete
MKTGFAIVVGQVTNIEEGGFTGKDGSEVKKLTVTVEQEDAPMELEAWGQVATAFSSAGIQGGSVVIFKCKLAPREWEYNGKMCRRTSIRIDEYELLTDGNQSMVDMAKEAFGGADGF